MDSHDEKFELIPLEIHIRRGNARTKFIFFSLTSLAILGFLTALILSDVFWGVKILVFIFSTWLLVSAIFLAYEGYRCSFTKGPVFSFSRHGLIDHRMKLPKIYRWDEIISVAWAKRGSSHILQIKLVSPPNILSWGWIFGYHPYRISSGSIVSSKKRIAGRIKMAVPEGKYKTAKNMDM